MTQIISILQAKGGTAKTTTTIMLATAFAEKGKKVLVLDSDLQQNAWEWAERAGEGIGFKATLTSTPRTLKSAIDRNRMGDLDYILVDTPPGSNAIVTTAAEESDLALIPTGVSEVELLQTQRTIDSFDGLGTPIAVVLVNVDKRVKDVALVQESLQSNERAAVADAFIPMRHAIRKSFFKVPPITSKPFAEWMELADEIESALEQM